MSRVRNIQYPAPRPERFFTNPPDAYGIEAGAHLVPVKKVRKRPDFPAIRDSDSALRFLDGMGRAPNERLVVVPVDTHTKPLGAVIVSMGSLNEAPAYPREIFAPVIESRAAGFILAHNHPSGDGTPSHADIDLTAKILQGGELLGIPMLDHFVIGRDVATSIRKIAPALWDATRTKRAANPPRRGRRKNPRRCNSPLARLRKALRFTRTSPRVAELVRAIEEAPDLEGLASSLAARRLTKRRNPRRKAGKALSRAPKRRKAQSRPSGRKRGRMTRRRLQWAKA